LKNGNLIVNASTYTAIIDTDTWTNIASATTGQGLFIEQDDGNFYYHDFSFSSSIALFTSGLVSIGTYTSPPSVSTSICRSFGFNGFWGQSRLTSGDGDINQCKRVEVGTYPSLTTTTFPAYSTNHKDEGWGTVVSD